jgi:AICAR transformylase/IMP cyclohydrolase PurH
MLWTILGTCPDGLVRLLKEKRTIMKALLSVYDKTGVVELAAKLHELGVELLSSGGTAKAIAAANLPVTDVAELTGLPAMLGHRVVTLHPKVHGGILADRSDPEHLADMERYGIEGIDIVVVNLYPFSSDPSIELIDIGGPAMVRASAKNHAHVAVVVDPADYDDGSGMGCRRKRCPRSSRTVSFVFCFKRGECRGCRNDAPQSYAAPK